MQQQCVETLGVGVLGVEVFSLRPAAKPGNVKAFANVRLYVGWPDPLEILGAKVVQQEGRAAWVAAPSEKWTDQSGREHWTPALIWPRAWGEVITEAVLEAWRDHPEGLEERPQAQARYGQSGQARGRFGGRR